MLGHDKPELETYEVGTYAKAFLIVTQSLAGRFIYDKESKSNPHYFNTHNTTQQLLNNFYHTHTKINLFPLPLSLLLLLLLLLLL